jgi:LysM repeat protein
MDETDAKRRGSSLSNSSGSLSAPDLPSTDAPATASKGMCLAALGLGVFGVILGIAGIVMANGASAELTALKAKVEQTQDPQTVLKPKFDDIEERLGAAAGDAVRANNGVSDLGTKVQKLASAITQDREQINKNTSAISGHKVAAAKPVSIAPTATPAAAPSADARTDAQDVDSTNAAGQKVHTVASGDNFWSIAKEHGTTAAAIEAANPGVDAKHLKIGQQIVIPSSASAAAPAPAAPAAEAK